MHLEVANSTEPEPLSNLLAFFVAWKFIKPFEFISNDDLNNIAV